MTTLFHSFDVGGYYTGSANAPINPVTGKIAEINSEVATLDALPDFDSQVQRCRWIEGAWTVEQIPLPEPDPEPTETEDVTPGWCTRRQGLLALLAFGIKRADIEAQIAAIEDEIEREEAQIEYESAVWERSNPRLQQMWAALGGAPAQLVDVFRLAVTL